MVTKKFYLVMKIFMIYSFSNFHICNTVVLIILIMLYIQDFLVWHRCSQSEAIGLG